MGYREPLSWRVLKAPDVHGFFMYFDGSREAPGVRDLTEDEKSATLDSFRSVSGLIRSDSPEEIDGCELVGPVAQRVLRQLSLNLKEV